MCIIPPPMKRHISETIKKKKSMCINIALLVVVRFQKKKKTNIGRAHGTPPVG